jgi:hypothetical protein
VTHSSDSGGTLLVRAWLHDRGFVARVTRTPDIAALAPVSIVVATRRALHQEVDRWLNEMGHVNDEELNDSDGR